jgi:hypothetical protein
MKNLLAIVTFWLTLSSAALAQGSPNIGGAMLPNAPAPSAGGATPLQTTGTWTPTDASGASLVFTGVSAGYTQIGNMVFAYAQLTYPSTANGSNASIGGFPVTAANQVYARQCNLSYSNISTFFHMFMNSNTVTAGMYTGAGVAILNSAMSTGQMNFMCIYPAS